MLVLTTCPVKFYQPNLIYALLCNGDVKKGGDEKKSYGEITIVSRSECREKRTTTIKIEEKTFRAGAADIGRRSS